jgi:capsular polysaccharide biosynthesis protein
MRRVLEMLFRHTLLILSLIVLLPIIGVAVVYFIVPRTYQSTASLWAWHRYEVISPTGPESDLESTPAQTQATELIQLLETKKFDLAVVNGINLAPTLNLSSSVLNDPEQLDDALFTELAKNVIVTPEAYQLYTISYTNRNPYIAQQIVSAVIQNFGMQSTALSVTVGRSLLTNYQQQLVQAQQQLKQDLALEIQYAASHSPDQLGTDPQYQQLSAVVTQDTNIVQNIQSTINTIEESMAANSNVSSLYQIQDQPQVPQQALSRTTKFLIGGGIGLGIALLTDIVYLIILVRRDRSIYSIADLQNIVNLPVLMQLPTLAPTSVSLLTTSETIEKRQSLART